MNKEWKEKWLTALRSGKYKQGKYVLRNNDDEYCCLGVLCDVYDDSLWYRDNGNYLYNSNKEETLGEDVWSAIPDYLLPVFEFIYNNPIISYQGKEATLAGLNDDIDLDFNQIADVIEAQL